ncbi:hypothetical protein [Intestinibacter sp.]|uniref:hypothetical protein n=1 Tax=Intestinibacter sp. TaxID=1965304 RepID=UPI003F15E832
MNDLSKYIGKIVEIRFAYYPADAFVLIIKVDNKLNTVFGYCVIYEADYPITRIIIDEDWHCDCNQNEIGRILTREEAQEVFDRCRQELENRFENVIFNNIRNNSSTTVH